MPVKAGVIRAAARTTRRGAAETFTGVVFQDPVITAEAPSRLGGSQTGAARGRQFRDVSRAANCRVAGERLNSTLLGHSASHSERLFLPHTCRSQ
jgi:hypothetical protein